MNTIRSICGALAIAALCAPNAVAQSKPVVPPLADVASLAREHLVAFSQAVEAGDLKPFVARFTPVARAVFTPERFAAIAHQFTEKKISIPESRTAPLHFIGAPKFGVTGSLEATGFFIQDHVPERLVTFDLSWSRAANVWTPDGFGAKTFPKPDYPTNQQLEAVLAVVLAFNAALESGDFRATHALLHKSAQEANTPQAMAEAFGKFVRDKVYARDATADAIFFGEVPAVFDGGFMVVKAFLPVSGARLSFTLMCAKVGEDWKVKDIRAFVE